jgi:hypothetical protein
MWRVRKFYLYYFNPICSGKMVESKKALPKEPRLGSLMDGSPPHSRGGLDNSLHIYTSLQAYQRYFSVQGQVCGVLPIFVSIY